VTKESSIPLCPQSVLSSIRLELGSGRFLLVERQTKWYRMFTKSEKLKVVVDRVVTEHITGFHQYIYLQLKPATWNPFGRSYIMALLSICRPTVYGRDSKEIARTTISIAIVVVSDTGLSI
jgi:hypothetical protein